MLRLKIDLTACKSNSKDPFWRLERNGILQKTVLDYAVFLLQLYGVTGVRPVAYLNGTLLPDTESPLILRDDDLLRIFPEKTSSDTQVVPSGQSRSSEFLFPSTRDNRQIENGQPSPNGQPNKNGQSAQNLESTNASFSNGSYHTVLDCPGTSKTDSLEKPANSETVPATPESDLSEDPHNSRKRKRGKRRSRTRSKRVSFDVLGEVGENESRLLESTPFHNNSNKNNSENNETLHQEDLVEKQSEAYVTALGDELPGVSNRSKKSVKFNRKSRKAATGVGVYLAMLTNELGASDANNTTDSIFDVSDMPAIQVNGEQDPTTTCNDGNKDLACVSDFSTIEANHSISCDIGLFNTRTSEVENYSNVQLQIMENNTEKKFLIAKHLKGDIGENKERSEFKVDWGMLSCVKLL